MFTHVDVRDNAMVAEDSFTCIGDAFGNEHDAAARE